MPVRDDTLVEKLMADFFHRTDLCLTTQRFSYIDDWTDVFDYTDAPTNHGWAWAGAPFVTPPTVDLTTQLGTITAGNFALANDRAFLYKAATPTDSNLYTIAGLVSIGVGFRCGIRLDDGTDNNYVEVVLYVSQASPTQWIEQIRWQTGGGGVNTASGDALPIPHAYILQMSITGVKWTAWYATPLLRVLWGIGGRMWKPNSGPGPLAWTPTRHGLVFDQGGAAVAAWYRAIVERYKGE